MNTCALLDVAIKAGVREFIFSSTAAVYGNAGDAPVREDAPTVPISPYGTSKLMSEIMLHDAAKAHGLRFVALRYFNVAGADPKLRTGQATPAATHLIKVACETAIGKRPKMRCIRDRLSHAGRHLHPRLHSCQRSCQGAFGGACLFAQRRRERDVQLRIRPRLFRSRGDRGGAARERPGFSGGDFRPPSRRSALACGERGSHPLRLVVASAIPEPRYDRRPCARVGKAACGPAKECGGLIKALRRRFLPIYRVLA